MSGLSMSECTYIIRAARRNGLGACPDTGDRLPPHGKLPCSCPTSSDRDLLQVRVEPCQVPHGLCLSALLPPPTHLLLFLFFIIHHSVQPASPSWSCLQNSSILSQHLHAHQSCTRLASTSHHLQPRCLLLRLLLRLHRLPHRLPQTLPLLPP